MVDIRVAMVDIRVAMVEFPICYADKEILIITFTL